MSEASEMRPDLESKLQKGFDYKKRTEGFLEERKKVTLPKEFLERRNDEHKLSEVDAKVRLASNASHMEQRAKDFMTH